MRQLELKNENSEASLRDMQVIFIFSRNPRESLYRNNNVINHKTQKYFQNVLWVCLNIMNLCIDKENQACQIGYCSFIVWLGRKLQKLFVNLMHKKQFSFEETNFLYINYLHKSKEVAKCLHSYIIPFLQCDLFTYMLYSLIALYLKGVQWFEKVDFDI